MKGAGQGLRIGVVGATGILGGEVLGFLDESSLEVSELVPIATERSLGEEIEFQGRDYPILTEPPRMGALDLLFLCGPADVSLEYAREALKASVPCIDASGALALSPEVTPRMAGFGSMERPEAQPLLVSPPGAALPLLLALRPLAEAVGIERVVGTALEAASAAGRRGIESLYEESIALFNQDDVPEPGVFGRPVAFDCLPALGDVDDGGATRHEAGVAQALVALLGDGLRVALTHVRVPAFVGFGASLAIEMKSSLSVKEASELLTAAPGVELWEGEPDGLTLRAVAGRNEAVVGRLREDPSSDHGLLLWISADVLRLAARNAVQLAVARVARLH